MTFTDIVVVNWNTRDHLAACLQSLGQPPAAVITVVDNGSGDGSAAMVAADFPHVRLLANDANRLFTPALNQGLAGGTGDYVLWLNSDTRLTPAALDRLRAYLDEHPDVAAVAPRLVDAAGQTQPGCMSLPTLAVPLFYFTTLAKLWPGNPVMRAYYLRDWDHEDSRPVAQPPAACFLMRRAVYAAIGPLDESMPLFFSDVDYCQRLAAAGQTIYYLAAAAVFHAVGASTGRLPQVLERYHQDRITYYRKWFGRRGALVCKLSLLDLAFWELVRVGRAHGLGAAWRGSARWLASVVRRAWREW